MASKSLLVSLSVLLIVGQVSADYSFLFRGKTIRDGVVEMAAAFQNMIFDIVDEGFQKNPKLYKEMKPSLDDIRENIVSNMKFINEFAVTSGLWLAKETTGYLADVWAEHGQDILSGQYDHEMAFNATLHALEEAEKFFAIKGLGLEKVLHKVLSKNKRMKKNEA